MSRALRDACLGIIELAHPDARPELRDEYKKVFRMSTVTAGVTADDLANERQRWTSLFKVSGDNE